MRHYRPPGSHWPAPRTDPAPPGELFPRPRWWKTRPLPLSVSPSASLRPPEPPPPVSLPPPSPRRSPHPGVFARRFSLSTPASPSFYCAPTSPTAWPTPRVRRHGGREWGPRVGGVWRENRYNGAEQKRGARGVFLKSSAARPPRAFERERPSERAKRLFARARARAPRKLFRKIENFDNWTDGAEALCLILYELFLGSGAARAYALRS